MLAADPFAPFIPKPIAMPLWPISAPDPVEAIKERMERIGYGQFDLAALLGSRSRASEILSRKRPLTMEMAWKLNREWGIPAESLIRPYDLKP